MEHSASQYDRNLRKGGLQAPTNQILLSFPDEPPVAGYSRANGNSMIDWCSGEADRMLLGWSDYVMAR